MPLPPTTTPTFASVAATATAVTRPDHRSATQPPVMHTRAGPKPTNNTPASEPPAARQQQRRKRPDRRDPHRAIVRWTGSKPDPTLRSASDIKEALDAALPTIDVAAVSWTPTGNLAIHLKAPHTATQLLYCSDIVIQTLGELWELDGDPLVELDTPWTRVVIHGIPVDPYFNWYGVYSFWNQLERQGFAVERVATATPMLKDGDRAGRSHMSLKLAFSDNMHAQHILSQKGIVLYDTFCRVSRYRC
ncbi:hypothetical protein C8F01DRAFT_1248668 [Mycena amicta]|nr:hypothetical protein C8F01DRAFT_1248668 [Mycena amicta]